MTTKYDTIEFYTTQITCTLRHWKHSIYAYNANNNNNNYYYYYNYNYNYNYNNNYNIKIDKL